MEPQYKVGDNVRINVPAEEGEPYSQNGIVCPVIIVVNDPSVKGQLYVVEIDGRPYAFLEEWLEHV